MQARKAKARDLLTDAGAARSFDALGAEVRALAIQVGDLRTDLKPVLEARSGELEVVKQLRKDMDEAHSRIRDLSSARERLEGDVARLRDEAEEHRKDNEQLSKAVVSLSESSNALREQITQLGNEMAKDRLQVKTAARWLGIGMLLAGGSSGAVLMKVLGG